GLARRRGQHPRRGIRPPPHREVHARREAARHRRAARHRPRGPEHALVGDPDRRRPHRRRRLRQPSRPALARQPAAGASMSFGQPWYLLLLLVLPLVVVFSRWSRAGLETGRSIAGSVVRSLLVAALVFAIADAQWVSKSYRTSTLFLLDHSFSVPPDIQRK